MSPHARILHVSKHSNTSAAVQSSTFEHNSRCNVRSTLFKNKEETKKPNNRQRNYTERSVSLFHSLTSPTPCGTIGQPRVSLFRAFLTSHSFVVCLLCALATSSSFSSSTSGLQYRQELRIFVTTGTRPIFGSCLIQLWVHDSHVLAKTVD